MKIFWTILLSGVLCVGSAAAATLPYSLYSRDGVLTADATNDFWRIVHDGTRDWALTPKDKAMRPTVAPGEIFKVTCPVGRIGDGEKSPEVAVVLRDASATVITWSFNRLALASNGVFETVFAVPAGVADIQPRIVGNGPADFEVGLLTLERVGAVPLIENPSARYVLASSALKVEVSGDALALTVTDRRTDRVWNTTTTGAYAPFLLRSAESDGRQLKFGVFEIATMCDREVVYRLDDEAPDEFTVTVSGAGELAGGLAYPDPFAGGAGDMMVLPMSEGYRLPMGEKTFALGEIAMWSSAMSMAFFGVEEDVSGAGWMAIAETRFDAKVKVTNDSRGCPVALGPVWHPERGRMGSPRTVRYVFFDAGGYVAMARRYRRTAEEQGLVKTFREKARERPNVDRLLGAANVWYYPASKEPKGDVVAQELKAAGIDRFYWSNGGDESVIAALAAMPDVLVSRYDCYRDIYSEELMALAGMKQTPMEICRNTSAWPDCAIWNSADSNDVRQAWGITCLDGVKRYCAAQCALCQPAHLREHIGWELQTNPYNARFIDVTAAVGAEECENPAHPMTRTQCGEACREILRVPSEEFGLVVGSEQGVDFVVPCCDFFEGMMSPTANRMPHGRPGAQRADIFREGEYPTGVTDEELAKVIDYHLNEKYRVPLFELVFHDCCCAHWYWYDYSNRPIFLWRQRDLLNVLYGTAPMYIFDHKLWEERRDAFVESFRRISPVARRTGYSRLLDHRALTSDRRVQRSFFADGTEVTVNFGSAPYRLENGTDLAPQSHAVRTVCHWTGAADRCWTNAANWAEGTVPGRWRTPSGELVGETGSEAVFGDLPDGVRETTVDLSGVFSVGSVVTTGTNRYTFGTSPEQALPIEPFGLFSAAETSETPVAKLNALLQLGVECMATNWGGETVRVRNNSREALHVGAWGKCTKSSTSTGTCGEPAVRFEGTGDLCLDGEYVKDRWYMVAQFALGGKLTVNVPTLVRRCDFLKTTDGSTAPLEVELAANGTLEPISCYNYLYCNERDVRIGGEGVFKFGVGVRSGAGVICETSVSKVLTFACRVENKFIGGEPPDSYPQRLAYTAGGGSLVFETRDNAIQGLLMAVNGSAATLAGDTFGQCGAFGSFGDVSFRLGHDAVLRHTGAAADATDRAIVLSNKTASVAGAKLEQCGTGAFTVESAVTTAPGMTGGKLTLGGASSAPATFAGTLADGITVVKTGDCTWTFAPQGTYAGAIALQGGSLVIGRPMTVAKLTADAAKAADVILPDGVWLAVADGTLPANVTLNGHPATLDEANRLVEVKGSAHVYRAAADGDWFEPANWKWNDAPGETAEKDVFVDAPGDAYAVTLDRPSVTTNLIVRNVGSGTATLFVTNTTLDVVGHTTREAMLRVNAGGRLEAVDATVRVSDLGNAQGDISGRSSVDFRGGTVVVRGTSSLVDAGIPNSRCTSGKVQNRNCNFDFVDAQVAFDDDATFTTEAEDSKTVFYHAIKPSAADKTSTVVFRGRSRPDFSVIPWTLNMGGNGGRAVLVLDSACENEVRNLWNQTYVGCGSGLSEMKVTRGRYAFGTYDVFHVASCGSDSANATASRLAVTGRVEIAAGATLTVNGSQEVTTTYGGMGVGQGIALQQAHGTSYLRGEMTIRGTYVQRYGGFYVGMGPCGDGEVVQSGVAEVMADAAKAADAAKPGHVVIGGFGGHGRYRLTDGAFTTCKDVYVGGMRTDDVPGVAHKNAAFLDGQHTAQGTLSVSGGTFETKRDLILGRDGTGRLELSGGGVVKASVVTVCPAAGRPASSVTFAGDAQGGFGTLVADTVDFAAGTKVAVDAAACPRRRTAATLMTLANGATGRENVILELRNADSRAQLLWSSDGKMLRYRLDLGSVVIVR